MENEEPLTETERQELERLRSEVALRFESHTLQKAQNFAAFIWGSRTLAQFNNDCTLLWATLPQRTQQDILDFVLTKREGPCCL